jgi:hypothetical protein
VNRWLKIAPGAGHTLAVGDDGVVYLDCQSPVQFALQGVPWKDAALSGFVTTLTVDGRAYQHGKDLYGQDASILVSFPPSVTQWLRAESSMQGVVLQAQNGELYLLGGGGILGGGQNPLTLLTRPPSVSQWADFCAGGYHILGLGNDGQLYAWGRNWEGELGNGNAGADVAQFIPVLLPTGVTKWKTMAAGLMHSLAIGDDCSLYAWGDNSYGQLGLGYPVGQNRPTRVSNVRALCGAPVVFAQGEAAPLDDGSVHVQFTSDLNRAYLVQYSEDLVQWKTALPPVIGTGGTVEWIDDGPPKTDTHPTSQARRLYRLIYAP